jgi:hypothetical protein
MMNIKSMLDKASVLLEIQGSIRDAEAKGTLRGGSVGWMSTEGEFVGTCPRRAYARMEGYNLEDNSAKQAMFQGGHLSEEGVVELLKLLWHGTIKREEEVPIRWETTNGTPVTGRPDVVLFPEGSIAPHHGLELKLISSLWTALEVIQLPKTIHVLQAMHYSHMLGVPWTLVYVNRTNWALLSEFAMKKVPKQGEPGSEYVEYVERNKMIDTKEGGKKKIKFIEGKAMLPFHHTYPLRWNPEGEVEIQVGEEWQTSFISWAGISRFYEFVSRIKETGDLGTKPVEVDVLGCAKNFDPCKYCPLLGKCDGKKMSLDTFTELCEDVHRSVSAAQQELLQRL